MSDRKAKPTLKLKKKPTEPEKPVELTPVAPPDYEIPVFVKENTAPYDESHISFSANRKQKRSDKQSKDRNRDKHAHLDQYN